MKNKFYERYKPDDKMYILLIVMAVSLIVVCTGGLDFGNLLTGVIASIVVAWILEMSECSRKNKELMRKKELVFSEYKNEIKTLQEIVMKQSDELLSTKNACFEQCLEIIRNPDNYEQDNSKVSREQVYKRILWNVKRIKQAVRLLGEQYFLLIELDVIDENISMQHFEQQDASCDFIIMILELARDKDDYLQVNKSLSKLVEDYNDCFQ